MKKWVYDPQFEEWVNEEYTIQKIRKKEKFRLIHDVNRLGIYDSLAEAKVEAKRHKEG